MMRPDKRRIDLNMNELETILEQARASLSEDAYNKLKAAVETLEYLTDLIGDKETTIRHLRNIIFGASTEKSSSVLGSPPANSQKAKTQEDKKQKGHGRNSAKDYTGAKKIKIRHQSLKAGDVCPDCGKGKVYHGKVPAYIVRLTGCAPIGATVWELENLRCNLCLKVFTAQAPAEAGSKKYDETAGSMIALLKYGSGFPFNRLQRLQGSMGIPLPSATQWEIVREVAGIAEPAFQELIRQGAQGEVLHNDDTTAKILALMKARRDAAPDPKTRTGIFTSGSDEGQTGCSSRSQNPHRHFHLRDRIS